MDVQHQSRYQLIPPKSTFSQGQKRHYEVLHMFGGSAHCESNAIVYAEAYIVIDPNTVFVFDAQAVFVFNTQAIIFAHSYTAFFHDCFFNSRLEPISVPYVKTTPAYYFESSGTKNTFQACSALCKADSKCLSFGYGEANCMLFDVTAIDNTNYNPMSPYTFYDAACPAELPGPS
ncbi:hypothetical protein J4E80_005625 [Alternaria sp. BMP 0032]|nr:hypothetical protein J4E80_005625 [Alternaria sp. BMP 0032]